MLALTVHLESVMHAITKADTFENRAHTVGHIFLVCKPGMTHRAWHPICYDDNHQVVRTASTTCCVCAVHTNCAGACERAFVGACGVYVCSLCMSLLTCRRCSWDKIADTLRTCCWRSNIVGAPRDRTLAASPRTLVFTFYAGVAWSRSKSSSFTAFAVNKTSPLTQPSKIWCPVCVECLLLRHRGPAPFGANQRAPKGRPTELRLPP